MTNQPIHPNQRLSAGRGQRDPELRRRLLLFLRQHDPDTLPPNPGPPRPLSLAAIADELGISRQRVSVLARREGVRGMTAASADDGRRKLRGRRRYFEKESDQCLN